MSTGKKAQLANPISAGILDLIGVQGLGFFGFLAMISLWKVGYSRLREGFSLQGLDLVEALNPKPEV